VSTFSLQLLAISILQSKGSLLTARHILIMTAKFVNLIQFFELKILAKIKMEGIVMGRFSDFTVIKGINFVSVRLKNGSPEFLK
jgi:hypothetical protein